MALKTPMSRSGRPARVLSIGLLGKHGSVPASITAVESICRASFTGIGSTSTFLSSVPCPLDVFPNTPVQIQKVRAWKDALHRRDIFAHSHH